MLTSKNVVQVYAHMICIRLKHAQKWTHQDVILQSEAHNKII